MQAANRYASDTALWNERVDDVVVLVYRTMPTSHRQPPSLRLPMLRADVRYAIERLDPSPEDTAGSRWNDATLAAGARQGPPPTAHGAWLAAVGLPLPRLLAEAVLVYRMATPLYAALQS